MPEKMRLVIALMLAVTILVPGCRRNVELKEISADLVPSEYKTDINSFYSDLALEIDNLVWRAYKDFGDYILVACTFEAFDEDGFRFQGFSIWARGTTADWATQHIANPTEMPRFAAAPTRVKTAATGRVSHIDIGGVALDERIAKVRVVTTGGTVAETEPFDGFWVIPFGIFVDNEHVAKVQALDEDGKVLYQHITVQGKP